MNGGDPKTHYKNPLKSGKNMCDLHELLWYIFWSRGMPTDLLNDAVPKTRFKKAPKT